MPNDTNTTIISDFSHFSKLNTRKIITKDIRKADESISQLLKNTRNPSVLNESDMDSYDDLLQQINERLNHLKIMLLKNDMYTVKAIQ